MFAIDGHGSGAYERHHELRGRGLWSSSVSDRRTAQNLRKAKCILTEGPDSISTTTTWMLMSEVCPWARDHRAAVRWCHSNATYGNLILS
jgi:hypothetical protein